MTETKTYSAMLYLLADQIDNDGPEFESAETVREAAERMDTQTVAINVLTNALYVALPFVEDHEGSIEYKAGAVKKALETIRSAIGSTKGGAACN